MKKAIGGFLAAALLLCAASSPVRAEGMVVSRECIEFIKRYEGFRSHVYWDNGQTYIGYGTRCSPGDYPGGVTEGEAEALLIDAVSTFATRFSNLLNGYGITLKQHQFDALMSLTYNIGNIWMDDSNRLFAYLKSGFEKYSDLEILNAIATWCHIGQKVSSHLVERRLSEARMFLYGDYSGENTQDYCFVKFNPGEGDIEHSIAFFPADSAYGALPVPTRAGYFFAGWVTEDGKRLSTGDLASENRFVTAEWLPPAAALSDITPSDWYYTYVLRLISYGVISGFEDGTFRPGSDVTYGQAIKLILKTIGLPDPQNTDNHWATGYIEQARYFGILDENETVSPDAAISREDVARYAARALAQPPLDPEPTFADTQDGYALALYHTDIITGEVIGAVRYFHPQTPMTRAEISAVLCRMLDSGLVL
jgi:GH24 family phage-related lysozyme (muramidase)